MYVKYVYMLVGRHVGMQVGGWARYDYHIIQIYISKPLLLSGCMYVSACIYALHNNLPKKKKKAYAFFFKKIYISKEIYLHSYIIITEAYLNVVFSTLCGHLILTPQIMQASHIPHCGGSAPPSGPRVKSESRQN